jgi:3-deoxy-manno-octulosonate cytidylyltransferase (CMP-KDO synthetase)
MTKKLIIGIIPARMASTRFPGKPLALIQGIPMIGHCYYRSKMCALLDDVYIATCDTEIAEYIHSIGGKAVMTNEGHTRASDRTAEALLKIEQETGKKYDIVVMIQGDEPMLRPEMIEAAVEPLAVNSTILVSNLMAPLRNKDELTDPNEVKVVVNNSNFALYFSREPIPSEKKITESQRKIFTDNINKQVCIIPYQRDFLLKFNQLKPTPLEIIESVDMLRVLEHGFKVKMIPISQEMYSVDNIEDKQRVEMLMQKDDLISKYQ